MANYNLQRTIPIIERSLAFFKPHHLELRKRLIKICISILCSTAVAYIFAEQIAVLFISPLFDANPLAYKLVYTRLPEAFLAYIKLALVVGVICSMPVILHHLWAFISPGLQKQEKKLVITIVFWGTILFISGACFAYFVVLPKMLVYFMSYASNSLEPLPKFGNYLTFVGRTILAFGISFQIPFLITMAIRMNLIQATYFRSKRIYFYLAIVILACLLSAGDFMATTLLAFPLFFLYEMGLFLGIVFKVRPRP